MSFMRDFCIRLLCYTISFSLVNSITYKWKPLEEDFFSNCPGNPNNLSSLMDLSELIIEWTDENDLIISGGSKVVWDVEPTDRIVGRLSTYKFERGNWQPTIFNGVANDLCKNFYDKGQYWYDFWTKHIQNKENFTNCVNKKGSTFKFESYIVEFQVSDLVSLTFTGRYKIVLSLMAISESNQQKMEICFQFLAEAVRIY